MADTRSMVGDVRAPIDIASLGAWVKAHVHPFEGALALRQFSHGQSNPTYLLSFPDGHEPLVLRKQPDGNILPSAHDVTREFRILVALHAHSHVPVPRPVALCADASVVGTPFYLMAYVRGRVFLDPRLPELKPAERYAVHHAMCEALARIHAVDWAAAGLADFARPGGYAGRQVKRWRAQSAAAGGALRAAGEGCPPALDELGAWLAARAPAMDGSSGAPALVHGDFRLDNLVFTAGPQLKVAAVLDWELATVGDARADLGYVLAGLGQLAEGLGGAKGAAAGGARLRSLGVPSADQFALGYARETCGTPLSQGERSFFCALADFRLAAIQQGVLARALAGNASSERAREAGALFRESAERGLRHARAQAGEPAGGERAADGSHPLDLLPCAFSGRVRQLYDRLDAFITARVLPAEAEAAAELAANTAAGARWQPLGVVSRLKAEARAAGLWNLWLSPELGRLAAACCSGAAPGLGLSTLEYAPLAELSGRSGLLAPEALNCSAPDTGNMELLIRFGSAAQQAAYLRPLLDGEIRSCYAMTEPDVASSDASSVELEIRRAAGPGGELGYVLRGRKWWVSGAGDPRCKLALVLGRMAAGGAGAHGAHSVLLVPMDAAGVRVVRPLGVFGYDDAPHGHCEIRFDNVWVGAERGLLLGEGRGFEMAQARLGPGRVHHCMRVLGLAERCVEAMCRRAKSRAAFGELLAHKSSVHDMIAQSRADLDSARLLTLSAAHCMDRFGNRTAAQQIALIKLAAPSAACAVIDRAIQLWGGAGVSDDTELAYAYAAARSLRLADGPDAVHSRTVARAELLKAKL